MREISCYLILIIIRLMLLSDHTHLLFNNYGDMGFQGQIIRNVHTQVPRGGFNLKGMAVWRILGWDG